MTVSAPTSRVPSAKATALRSPKATECTWGSVVYLPSPKAKYSLQMRGHLHPSVQPACKGSFPLLSCSGEPRSNLPWRRGPGPAWQCSLGVSSFALGGAAGITTLCGP